MEARHSAEDQVLAEREAEITRDRHETERRHQAEKPKLERELGDARRKYEQAMRHWRG